MNSPHDPITEIMELSHCAAELLEAIGLEGADRIKGDVIAPVFAVVFRRIQECVGVLDNDGWGKRSPNAVKRVADSQEAA